MENFNRKTHWENIYQTKQLQDVSWYQPIPTTSLQFIRQFTVPLSAKIIDIGGGDSFFVDHLLELGYSDITVLDISEAAINRAKQRLGANAEKVTWIVADATDFKSTEHYDFWHDRAAFHFLTNDGDIARYIDSAQRNIKSGGVLVVGTFSEQGPKKCSGIEIKQYSDTSLSQTFQTYFEKKECITTDHPTPSGSIQNFVFCSFTRR